MAKSNNYLQFKILLEQDEDGYYVASVPELPGCHTQAKTLEKVRDRIKEAIDLYRDINLSPEEYKVMRS